MLFDRSYSVFFYAEMCVLICIKNHFRVSLNMEEFALVWHFATLFQIVVIDLSKMTPKSPCPTNETNLCFKN